MTNFANRCRTYSACLHKALGIRVFISVAILLPGWAMASEAQKNIEWSYPHGQGKTFPDPGSAATDFCNYFLEELKKLALNSGSTLEARIKTCKPGSVRRIVEGDLYFTFGDYYAPALIEVETYIEGDGKWHSGGEIPYPMVGNCSNCYVAHLPNYQLSSAAPESCEKTATGTQAHQEHINFEQRPVSFSFVPEAASRNSDYLTFNSLDEFKAHSSGSTSEKLACEEGFDELRATASAPWLSEVSVQYSDSCGCLLKKGYDTVGELVITSGMDEEPEGIAAIQLHSASGPTITQFYQQSCTGTYRPIDNSRVNLAATEQGGWALSSYGQIEKVFNASGDLITVQNEQGQAFTYETSGGHINSIQAPSGAKLTFSYTDGRLTTIEKPDKTTRSYLYGDSRFPNTLTGIINEKGVKKEAWQLDEKGRVVEHELAGGAEKTTTAFNSDGSTTVTNPLGKQTHYFFTEVAGSSKVTRVVGEPTSNCLGSNQSYTYTASGLLSTQTDWNDLVTKFEYDSLGREVTRTKGYGTAEATIAQTCWEGTFYPPVRIIEPTRVTLFRYRYDNALLEQKIVKPRPAGLVDCSTKL